MTLYYDLKIQFVEVDVVSTISQWHRTLPLLAVGSYSLEKGGFVTIFDQMGIALKGCDWPTFLTNQVTTLAWHPYRKLLVVGWDTGELYIWLEGAWAKLEAPHTSALSIVRFSPGGGRLLTADSAGSVAGWNSSTGAPLTSFHHQLSEVLTHVTFGAPGKSGEGVLRGLARAAVGGDQGALDVLSAWRPRTTVRVKEVVPADNYSCYVSLDNGIVLYINGSGQCTEVLNSPGVVQFIAAIGKNHLLVAWDSGGTLSLTKFSSAIDGSLSAESHVRLAARNGQSICLAGGFTVAVLAGEAIIRLWNCASGENDVLALEEGSPTHGDIFTCISYCNISDTLSCGTAHGRIYLWRRNPRNQWKLISSTSVKGTVKDVCWGSEAMIHPLLAVNCITNVLILKEEPICWTYSRNLWSVQQAATELKVTTETTETAKINVINVIKAMACKGKYLVVGNGEKVQVLMNSKEAPLNYSPTYEFNWKTVILIIHEDLLIGLVGEYIEAKSVSGAQVGILPTTEGEGEPITITNTDRFLAIATIDGYIRIAEVTRKGFKMLYPAKNCYQMIEDFGEIMHLSVNNKGTLVCLSIANAGLTPDPRIYLWDAPNDVISYTLLSEKIVLISIMWDDIDARLVSVHTRSVDEDKIHLLFAHNNKLEEYRDWQDENSDKYTDFTMASLSVPYIAIFHERTIKRLPILKMSYDVSQDIETIRQFVDFLFNMTVGQLEHAVLKGGIVGGGAVLEVWTELARACVVHQRPEVGAVCLAKMGDIKGAMMMRKALSDCDLGTICQTAILAITLGMSDKAEEILKEVKKNDLVTKLIDAKKGGFLKLSEISNEGQAALSVKAAKHMLAKTLWASGEIGVSIEMFEKAKTQVPHVPRMLISLGQNAVLAQLVLTSKDPALARWWGHYLESMCDLDGAITVYAQIKDYGAQTRLLCHIDQLDEAEKLVTKSPAAAYYLARHLEMQPDQVEKAVKLYLSCGATWCALRTAGEARAWTLVWRAGNAARDPRYAGHAARLLHRAGRLTQAISLYRKAGLMHSAVALALESSDTEALTAMAQTLPPDADAGIATRLAAHLMAAGKPSQAAAMLATAGKYEEALAALEAAGAGEDAGLTEELGERLAPPPGTLRREQLLRRLADVLGARGLYHAAAKRLAQAGDKAGAMRWLVRSGDTERMVRFAAASRDVAVQLTCAHHLRAAGVWRTRPDFLRHVLTFYQRARAHRHLAAFYTDCAKMEIDEYQNYEKAYGALGEAVRSLGRASHTETGPETTALQEQATLIRKYMDIKSSLERGDYKNGMASGQQLLESLQGASSGLVHRADLLKLLVQHSTSAGRTAEANVYQERLQALMASEVTKDQQEKDSNEYEVPEIIEEI